VIVRPSTPQILTDVAEELRREILPELTTTTLQIRLQMIMSVLEQCAARSGIEIALMRAEIASYRDYADRVADATGSEAVRAAADAVVVGDDLRLDAVSAEYASAGEALATALEAALDAGEQQLVAEGEGLLTARIATEQGLTALATAGR